MDRIFIRLPRSGETVTWTKFDQSGECLVASEQADIDDLDIDLQDQVILFAPSDALLITSANLPAKLSKSQLKQALPFALEESLSQNIEDCHFAVAERHQDKCPVCIVDKSQMQHWYQLANRLPVAPLGLFPDCLALPHEEGVWQIYLEQQSALLRSNRFSGFACSEALLPSLLAIKLKEYTGFSPQKIKVHSDQAHINAELIAIRPDIEWEQNNHIDLLTVFASSFNANDAINLLQHEYQIKRKHVSVDYLWAISAIAFASMLLIILLGNVIEYQIYQSQQKTLNQQVEEIYRQIYPDAKAVISPRLRIEQELKQLGKGDQQRVFLSLLASIGQAIPDRKAVTIASANYQNQQMTIQLKLTNFQQLEDIIKRLEQQNLRVNRDNAQSEGNQVAARLTIGKNS